MQDDDTSIWELMLALRAGSPASASARLRIEARRQRQGIGALDQKDRDLLEALMPVAVHPGRLAIAQLGQSLDGRIATESGDSWYINGEAARAHLHRLRALVDAVLIGAGTAAEDRPQLTVRHVSGPDPVPVILDPRGRVRAEGPLFERAFGAAPVLHLVGEGLDLPPPPAGVERITLPAGPDGVSPALVLERLSDRGLKRVLVEGGGVTVSRFLEAGCLDRLHLLIAPLIIGSGRPGLQLNPIQRLTEARRPPIRSFALGEELLVDVNLR